MNVWGWVTAFTAVAGLILLWRALHSFRSFRTLVLREYPQRIYDLRRYRWLYSDLFLPWFLRARIGKLPTIIFTGDSTIAQMNVPPGDTIVGQLDFLASIRRGGRTARVINVGVNGAAEGYLDTSIRVALDCGASHVFAGVTIRDYTNISDDLFARPELIPNFLDYYILRHGFSWSKPPSLAEAFVQRLFCRADYLLTGARVLGQRSYSMPAPGEELLKANAPGGALYVEAPELMKRTQRKKT